MKMDILLRCFSCLPTFQKDGQKQATGIPDMSGLVVKNFMLPLCGKNIKKSFCFPYSRAIELKLEFKPTFSRSEVHYCCYFATTMPPKSRSSKILIFDIALSASLSC